MIKHDREMGDKHGSYINTNVFSFNLLVLDRVSTQLNIWTIFPTMKTGLSHFHRILLILDGFLQSGNVVLCVLDLCAHLDGSKQNYNHHCIKVIVVLAFLRLTEVRDVE